VVLEIVGPDGTTVKSMTMADIQALPVSEGQAGIKSSTGQITPPAPFRGVSLKDLAALVPGFDESMGMNIVASDGYAITFSYNQVMNGDFTEYDPGTGDELKSPFPLTAILAYEMNGQPLDPQQDGDLRVAVVSAEPRQVVDGHWAVKWVNKIEIKSLGKDWTLHLEGMISEDMDRGTFESGSAPNCHGVTWKDDKAQEWLGIPLWLLVGRVDDDIKHEGPAFNDALAAAGYTIEVTASDGYSVTFDIARVARNNNIIVAYKVNDNPLPDQYFPLRLVGSDLTKKEMGGMIASIVLHIDLSKIPAATNTPVPTATPEPVASNADLVITGLVGKEQSWTEADLRGMEVVKITAEHPKQGMTDYEGVRLNALLDLAQVKPEAKKLVLIAADGYKSEVFLAEVRACTDCLVAFTDTPGVLNLVMPGLPSSVWSKDIIRIEVQ
jgi:DMSO/TMAO reductase YedYZ molybdopterin-dependent catalytic subunit